MGGASMGGKKARPTTARVPVSWSQGLRSTSVDSEMQQADVIGFDDPRSMLTDLENEHDQPFVVYLTGKSKEAKKRQGLLNAAFLDQRVGIAAQVTCMIKGAGDDIDNEHPFYRHIPGDVLPRVAVFAADGTKIGQLNGKATPGDVIELVDEAFARSYEGDLPKIRKAYAKLLTVMETLKSKKNLLDDEFLTAETRSKERKLEKKLAGLSKEADKLQAQKKKLLELKRRS